MSRYSDGIAPTRYGEPDDATPWATREAELRLRVVQLEAALRSARSQLVTLVGAIGINYSPDKVAEVLASLLKAHR